MKIRHKKTFSKILVISARFSDNDRLINLKKSYRFLCFQINILQRNFESEIISLYAKIGDMFKMHANKTSSLMSALVTTDTNIKRKRSRNW